MNCSLGGTATRALLAKALSVEANTSVRGVHEIREGERLARAPDDICRLMARRDALVKENRVEGLTSAEKELNLLKMHILQSVAMFEACAITGAAPNKIKIRADGFIVIKL
jgi:hypothetical protein